MDPSSPRNRLEGVELSILPSRKTNVNDPNPPPPIPALSSEVKRIGDYDSAMTSRSEQSAAYIGAAISRARNFRNDSETDEDTANSDEENESARLLDSSASSSRTTSGHLGLKGSKCNSKGHNHKGLEYSSNKMDVDDKRAASPAESYGEEDESVSTKKSTRFRWIVIIVLSLSGDGWSYEAAVMSSVLNLPQFIKRELVCPIYRLRKILMVKRHGA